jgi:hypothetical protein
MSPENLALHSSGKRGEEIVENCGKEKSMHSSPNRNTYAQNLIRSQQKSPMLFSPIPCKLAKSPIPESPGFHSNRFINDNPIA